MDESNGKQGISKIGESINGATVIKIGKKSIVVKKDGRSQVLRIIGGNSSDLRGVEVSLPTSVTGEFLDFKPVLSNTGPPVDENVPFEGISQFEPVLSETGPSVDKSVSVSELPHFELISNSTGPQIDD